MRKIGILFATIFLAGCFGGNSPIVETLPTLEELEKMENSENATGSAGEEISAIEVNCTAEQLQTCEEKATECVKNLEIANDRIQVLSDNIKKSGEIATPKLGNEFAEMFVYFFKNVPQKEFPFESCGAISSLAQRNWFGEFREKLTVENIFFAPAGRELRPEDFFGGCVSAAGKMAFFLGAGRGAASEFHLVKFDLENSKIAPAILPAGDCADCPGQFGKRRGAFIELFSDSGKKFRYFFDKNVLFEDAVLQ